MNLSSIDQGTIAKLRQHGQLRRCAAGEILFAIGERGNEMYLIEEGEVDLFFEAGKKPKRLGISELFGELAFIIGDHERTATAVAGSSGAQLRSYSQQELNGVLHAMPLEIFSMLRHACGYLVRSEQELIHQLNRHKTELELTMDYAAHIRDELQCYEGLGLVDPELGLFTRQTLMSYLDKLLDSSRSLGLGIGLLLVRLEGLEGLHQRLGAGYEKTLAPWIVDLLKISIRDGDLPARFGPRTFGVLLHDADLGVIQQVASEFCRQLRNHKRDMPCGQVQLEVRLGAAGTHQGDHSERLVQKAERATRLTPPDDGGYLGWENRLIPLKG